MQDKKALSSSKYLATNTLICHSSAAKLPSYRLASFTKLDISPKQLKKLNPSNIKKLTIRGENSKFYQSIPNLPLFFKKLRRLKHLQSLSLIFPGQQPTLGPHEEREFKKFLHFTNKNFKISFFKFNALAGKFYQHLFSEKIKTLTLNGLEYIEPWLDVGLKYSKINISHLVELNITKNPLRTLRSLLSTLSGLLSKCLFLKRLNLSSNQYGKEAVAIFSALVENEKLPLESFDFSDNPYLNGDFLEWPDQENLTGLDYLCQLLARNRIKEIKLNKPLKHLNFAESLNPTEQEEQQEQEEASGLNILKESITNNTSLQFCSLNGFFAYEQFHAEISSTLSKNKSNNVPKLN